MTERIDHHIEHAGPQRPNLVSPLKWLAALTAALILLQAILVGRGLYFDFDLIETHGIVGNITFLAVIGLLALTWLTGIPGSLGKRLLIITTVLTVLMVIQIGLGYEGRDSNQAASWHIPIGVLIMGVSVAILSLVHQIRTE